MFNLKVVKNRRYFKNIFLLDTSICMLSSFLDMVTMNLCENICIANVRLHREEGVSTNVLCLATSINHNCSRKSLAVTIDTCTLREFADAIYT